MLCLISGLLVRDGENLRGKFSTKVLDHESILKGLMVRLYTHGSQELTLGVVLMKELGTVPFKSYYFLSMTSIGYLFYAFEILNY